MAILIHAVLIYLSANSYMCRPLSGRRQVDLAYGATVGSILISAAAVWLWWLVVCLPPPKAKPGHLMRFASRD